MPLELVIRQIEVAEGEAQDVGRNGAGESVVGEGEILQSGGDAVAGRVVFVRVRVLRPTQRGIRVGVEEFAGEGVSGQVERSQVRQRPHAVRNAACIV